MKDRPPLMYGGVRDDTLSDPQTREAMFSLCHWFMQVQEPIRLHLILPLSTASCAIVPYENDCIDCFRALMCVPYARTGSRYVK